MTFFGIVKVKIKRIVLTIICVPLVLWSIAALIAIWSLDDAARHQAVVVHAACQRRMIENFKALAKYVHRHSDVPRDGNGQFSPDLLLCREASFEGCVDSTDCLCTLCVEPAGPAWSGWEWCKTPSKSEISRLERFSDIDSHGKKLSNEWVVMCHNVGFAHRIGKQYSAAVLLSSGVVYKFHWNEGDRDGADYRTWVKESFKNGVHEIPGFMRRQFTETFE